MFPYLSLGPFLLQTPGLALLIGVWVGASLTEREAKRLNMQAQTVYNLIFLGLVAGIIGARLAYVARFLRVYLDDPFSLFALNTNTFSAVDGLIIGSLVAVLYGKRKSLPLRPTLDALAPGLAVFPVSLGVAHILSGAAFGLPSDVPWAIYLWDESRHPTQIYETLLALWVLVVILKRPLGQPGSGLNFLLVLTLTAASRLVVEAFRGDSLIWTGGFRAAQVVSLFVLLAGLWLMRVWAKSFEYETS